MDRGRGQRSVRALLVAVTVALTNFYLMRLSNWAPGGDAAGDAGGQGIVVSVVLGLAVAVPWLLWIWSRPAEDRSTQRTSRLLRNINRDRDHHLDDF